ncbi:MAG: hypothetical protein ACJATI_003947 [Halioglobus sp.]|jgi:hypothetical protein
MGKSDKRKKLNKSALQRKSKQLEVKKEGLTKARKVVIGLALLDNTQGQDYENWEEYQLLSKALSRIQGLCSMTVEEAKRQQIIKEYDYEVPDGSKFVRPKHIAEDIRWASLRIQAKVRIIGFLEDGYIFQIVFLDKEHEFYPSTKKKT